MENELDQGRIARRAKALALGALAACVVACGNKSTPTPGKEAPPPASAPASAVSAAPSASAAASATTIPTLVPEPFTPQGTRLGHLFAIEGALMVTEGQRIGRIVDDGVEWVGKIPKETPGFGENVLMSVHGRWPDGVGAIYVTGEGRAPQPTYIPITGKGVRYVTAEGGGLGWIRGVATVGESTVVAAFDISAGVRLATVRGPQLPRRLLSDAQGGCKPGEVWKPFGGDAQVPAINPSAFASSPEGTLVSLGQLCDKRAPAAEVWDKAGKSRIVDLGRWWKKLSYWPQLLKGSGDELWAYTDAWSPILRYHDGAFEAVPDLGWPVREVFVSARGQLHAYDGQTIYRYDGKWTPVARLADPKAIGSIAIEKDAFWAVGGGVFRLRAGAAASAPEGCKGWFVYLYQASDKNEPNFTYPSTRKALATFPEAAAISLVEIHEENRRHLGVTVESRAQAEALLAHVKATMPDEDPRLFCYVPRDPRKIALDAKGPLEPKRK